MKRALLITVIFVLGFWSSRLLDHCVPSVTADGAGAAALTNGDVNGDGTLNLTDAIYTLNHLFMGGAAPVPIACPSVALPSTGQTQCYNEDGGVINCGSTDCPGQDGFYQAGCPSEGRFDDNGDGTVTDNCTGLMWQKDTADVSGNGTIGFWPEDAVTWQKALNYCENLQFARHSDWRLPNVRELQSIVDYGRSEPAIDPVFGTVCDAYWSSSTSADAINHAWYVNFAGGSVYGPKDSDAFYVRAVRSGP